MHLSLSLSLDIYICVCVCMYVYIYPFTFYVYFSHGKPMAMLMICWRKSRGLIIYRAFIICVFMVVYDDECVNVIVNKFGAYYYHIMIYEIYYYFYYIHQSTRIHTDTHTHIYILFLFYSALTTRGLFLIRRISPRPCFTHITYIL